MPTIRWDSKLASVAGKHAPKIEKAFGYTTVGDLLRHYPRRYVDKGKLSDLGGLVVDEHVTVIAQVLSVEQRTYPDRRTGRPAYRLEVSVATDDHELMLTFFDKKKHIADWRRSSIAPGLHGVFSGKVGRFRNKWQLTNPQTQLFADEEDDVEEAPALPRARQERSGRLERAVRTQERPADPAEVHRLGRVLVPRPDTSEERAGAVFIVADGMGGAQAFKAETAADLPARSVFAPDPVDAGFVVDTGRHEAQGHRALGHHDLPEGV